VTVDIGEERIELGPDDVDLSQETKSGWGVASDGGVTVALDLELTDDLRLEGLARDLVRVIQDARKAAGLDVSDRIALGIASRGRTADAVTAWRDYIAAETLAASIAEGELEGDVHREPARLGDDDIVVTLRRVA
jgi:isoleucyl-tRNA synthetase